MGYTKKECIDEMLNIFNTMATDKRFHQDDNRPFIYLYALHRKACRYAEKENGNPSVYKGLCDHCPINWGVDKDPDGACHCNTFKPEGSENIDKEWTESNTENNEKCDLGRWEEDWLEEDFGGADILIGKFCELAYETLKKLNKV